MPAADDTTSRSGAVLAIIVAAVAVVGTTVLRWERVSGAHFSR